MEGRAQVCRGMLWETQNYPFPKKRWNRPRIWLRPLLCLVWRWLMLEHLLQVCSTWLLAARPKRRLKVARVRWRWLCWVGEEKGWHWHCSVLTAYFWDWCACFPLSQEDECPTGAPNPARSTGHGGCVQSSFWHLPPQVVQAHWCCPCESGR